MLHAVDVTQAFSQVNPITAAFYDAVQMYAWALNKTLEHGGDPMNGRAVMAELWNKTFLSGTENLRSNVTELNDIFFAMIVSRSHRRHFHQREW